MTRMIAKSTLGHLRDRFWRAVWRRHVKYLPPAAVVTMTGCTTHVEKDATVPGFHIEVAREWRPMERG